MKHFICIRADGMFTYVTDPLGVLSGEDDLRRLGRRGRQASHQFGVPAVSQLEGDRELLYKHFSALKGNSSDSKPVFCHSED